MSPVVHLEGCITYAYFLEKKCLGQRVDGVILQEELWKFLSMLEVVIPT
jgi:hypothetical protein